MYVNYGMNSHTQLKTIRSPDTFKYQLKSYLIDKLNTT